MIHNAKVLDSHMSCLSFSNTTTTKDNHPENDLKESQNNNKQDDEGMT